MLETLNLLRLVITLYKMFYQNTWFCHHQKGGDCKNKNCLCKSTRGFADNNEVFVKELFYVLMSVVCRS